MTDRQKWLITSALKDQINTLVSCRDIRASEGNEESRRFFVECIEELQDAISALNEIMK